jgi:signal transduction histidine kinase
VNTSVEAYQEAFEEKKQTIVTNTPQSLIIQGDEARLRQIVDNLLSNAMKYSPEGGQIAVSIKTSRAGHPNTSQCVELSVTDSGQGFTDEDKTRLFGMFQRLSAQPTGGESSSGVGLASVKHLVELHGGTITLESTPGQGSTFIVRLPQS